MPRALLSRRDLAAAAALGAVLRSSPVWAGERWKIGLQLYTMRDLLKAEFEGTLAQVARLGYREVEFAGPPGADARRTRELLRGFDLTAPSLHIAYARLQHDTGAAFETAHRLGSRFVVCPWIDPAQRQTPDDWKRICDNLNAIGELAARSELVLAYHNHDFEFAKLSEGIEPYELLLERTDQRLVKFELDVYWASKGKLDPARLLRAHPSRFHLVHLKDMARDGATTELGAGTLDFAAILAAAAQSSVQHLFVEQDDSADPLRSIETSIGFLRRQPYFSAGP